MVAINEIFVESSKLLLESVFEVESGTIMSTGNRSLGYNVVDTRLDPSDRNYIVRTFDNAQAAQNYSNTINLELSRNSRFNPRTSDVGDNTGRIGSTTAKPPVEMDDLTRAQQNTLRRTGSIQFGGHTYTRAEIDGFTQAANARRAQLTRDAEAARGRLLRMDEEAKANPRRWARNNITLLRQMTRSTFAAMFPFTFRPGVSLAAYDGLKSLLENMYATVDNNTTEAEVMEKIQQVFGFWFITFAVPDLIGAMRMLARVFVSTIVRAIRAINAASMGASQAIGFFAGLPGAAFMLVKNIIQFIAVEAVIYFSLKSALERPEVQLVILRWFQNDYIATLGEWGYAGSEALNTLITREFNSKVVPSLEGTFDMAALRDVDVMTRTGVDPRDNSPEFRPGDNDAGPVDQGPVAQPIEPANQERRRNVIDIDTF